MEIFIIIYLITVAVAFIVSRIVVDKMLKEDKKFFDDSVGLMVAMFVCPFIPFINIVFIIIVIILSMVIHIDIVGASSFARKLFFIRDKEEKDEVPKNTNK